MRRGLALLALLTVAAAPPPTASQLQEAERARVASQLQGRAAQAKVQAAQAEERRLGQERVAAAAALRALETQSAAAADRVADLAQRRADIHARMTERAAAMAPFLPLIQRLAMYPAETLLAVPMPPEQAVRGIVVLGGLTRQIEADAQALRAEQAQLDAIEPELDRAVSELAAREAAQSRQAGALDTAIEQARTQRKQAEGDASEWTRRAAAEAARADGLRSAIARIEAERVAAEARAAAEAKQAEAKQTRPKQEAAARPTGTFSTLAVPVAGSVARGYGESGDGGPSSGIAYQAPPSARVVAPCSGRVVFSGPFRSFGLLAILDCGAGWHVVLSGFDRLDAQLGQAVQQGEPIGAMPGWNPLNLLRRPTLMLELRHDGTPTNPGPYLKASG